ncbi:ABC transporter ATP-binding protein [Actinocrinis puniceicyclus]|uniref:ABC transporter ATP-binding protein n=1 Tax=Actinocrinis puniceicyclus TaxID=977794 RepID=A0A8J8BDS0_9ACTN|nr:ABC transporter ATP-binding protein [Actinocrinis puniceicyclus]MBS2965573.1 ABC transporter ATP-binding protein [Actinocrinis puniceicyclus]
MTNPAAIEIAGLRKHFGRTRALDGLDLRVERGEVHGFLGPNGAGKSTTIRILLGLLRSDGGTVRLLGADPWRDAVSLHRRLAYVPGDVTLWPNLTGGEAIDLLGRLRGGFPANRRDELISRFELDPRKKGRAYSTGNRQKVALIAAFAGEPELLILDEPTSGLDPLMDAVFRQCVAEAHERGATVLLSSHILSEVEELCDRVSIIRTGRTVDAGSLAELRHLARTTITAQLVRRDADGIGARLRAAGVHELTIEGSTVRCQADPEALEAVLRALTDAGVRALTSRPPTLEELFIKYYAAEQPGEGRDEAAAVR